MSVRLITPPNAEPVSVAEARHACKIDNTGDAPFDLLVNSELERDITAMREVAEHRTQRSLMPQTWEVALDCFPDGSIALPMPSVISIVSVKYLPSDGGAEATMASNQYSLDNVREYEAWLHSAVGVSWPNTANVANAVRVQYIAGYASAAAVPASVKKWILSAVRFGRDGGCDGAGELPYDFNDALLSRIKAWGL